MQSGWWEFFDARVTALGKTHVEVAKSAGINRSLITQWKQGSGVSIENLRRLSPVLDVPMARLLIEAGHVAENELDAPPAPVFVDRGVSTDGLNAEQERQLQEFADFLRRSRKE